jgi:hypothetical protein
MRGDRARGSQHACLIVAASREAKQRKMKEGRQRKIFMRQCTCKGDILPSTCSPLPLQPVRAFPPAQGGGRLSHVPPLLSLPVERGAIHTSDMNKVDGGTLSHKQITGIKLGLHEKSYMYKDQAHFLPVVRSAHESSSE